MWTFLLHLQILCTLPLSMLLHGILVEAIIAGSPLETTVHEDLVLVARRHHQRHLDARHDALFSTLCLELDPLRSRALKRSRDNDLSAWLSVMPIACDNYDLTAQEFRDALAVRYKKPLLSVPPHCDGCGAPSSLDHFLICKKGGLIVQRHNEIQSRRMHFQSGEVMMGHM